MNGGAVFGICTGYCCISLRYRKQRMQRIVTAAFEQGLFRHTGVGETVDASRRGAPVTQVKEAVERPLLYELWHPEWPATSDRVTPISRPPVDWSEYNVRTMLDIAQHAFLTVLSANIRKCLSSEHDRFSTL
jgi:hypothetical protein